MSGSARVLSGPVHVMSHSARVMSGSARIISGLIPLHSEISPNNEGVKITDLFSFFIHEAKPKNFLYSMILRLYVSFAQLHFGFLLIKKQYFIT